MKLHCWVVLVENLKSEVQKNIPLLYSHLQHIQITNMIRVSNFVMCYALFLASCSLLYIHMQTDVEESEILIENCKDTLFCPVAQLVCMFI
jgi:hypothetical protein